MQNQEWIAKQIYLKNMYAYPYESLGSDVKHVVTDVDHFPYTRFYRGVYNDTRPHVWEREAGYHSLENARYKDNLMYMTTPHESPTQIPCSTVLPRKLCPKQRLSNTDACINSPP